MFNPTRLTLARKRRGLKKRDLAERVGLTPRSIIDYESGKREPPEESAYRLAKELEFPRAFFDAPTVEEPSLDAVSFRSLSSMTASQRDAAIATATIAAGFGDWIESEFSLPEPNVPDLRDLDAEHAAETLRVLWELGEKPISNMVRLLELHGVRVFSLATACREVDAFSFWRGSTPYVFLSTSKSAERGRFDAGHELAHLLLHRHGGRACRADERAADEFASALLMPRADVLSYSPSTPSVDGILRLKQRWKVSVAALNRRLYGLNQMTRWQYRGNCIEIAERGFRTDEPNAGDRETSLVLEKVLAVLEADGDGREQIAARLHISLRDLDEFIFSSGPRRFLGGGHRPAPGREPDRDFRPL